MSGLGTAAIQGILNEVCEAILINLCSSVSAHFPTSEEQVQEKIINMEKNGNFLTLGQQLMDATLQ